MYVFFMYFFCISSFEIHGIWSDFPLIIELDDGKIETGKLDHNLMVILPWVSGVDFPNKTNPMTLTTINTH